MWLRAPRNRSDAQRGINLVTKRRFVHVVAGELGRKQLNLQEAVPALLVENRLHHVGVAQNPGCEGLWSENASTEPAVL